MAQKTKARGKYKSTHRNALNIRAGSMALLQTNAGDARMLGTVPSMKSRHLCSAKRNQALFHNKVQEQECLTMSRVYRSFIPETTFPQRAFHGQLAWPSTIFAELRAPTGA